MGLDSEQVEIVRTVLQAYARGNAQNLIALCALRLSLSAHRERAPSTWDEVPPPDSDKITRPLPRLPAMTELSPAVQDTVLSLTKVGAPPGESLIPSAYRHLAYWPGLLVALEQRFAPFLLEPAPMTLACGVAVAGAEQRALQLCDLLPEVMVPTEETKTLVEQAINRFIDHMIGRMTVIVPMIQRALPKEKGL